MNRAGNYIKLVRINPLISTAISGESTKQWFIPYNSDISLSTQQELIQPIKEAFDTMKKAILTAGNNLNLSFLSAGVKALESMNNIFGIQFFTKMYHQSAWVGETPATFNIKLDFFRGMNNKWNSQVEVVNQMMEIMGNTVPSDTTNGNIIFAPAPTGLDCFTRFATSIVDNATSNTQFSGIALMGENMSNTQGNTALTNIIKAGTEGKTWTVEYGWMENPENDKSFQKFIGFSNLIVSQSAFSFSPQLERINSSTYVPISGTIDLSLKTQTILTSTDFLIGDKGKVKVSTTETADDVRVAEEINRQLRGVGV